MPGSRGLYTTLVVVYTSNKERKKLPYIHFTGEVGGAERSTSLYVAWGREGKAKG